MDTKRGDGKRLGKRVPVLAVTEVGHSDAGDPNDVVFDFTGLHRPELTDLALILTARLQSGSGDRVWARALPPSMWQILNALGLDHMFRRIPNSVERVH